MNNNYLRYSFFFIFLFFIFLLKYSYISDFYYFSDQDHVHIYEALAFNNFLNQTYFDHPGFICFFLLSAWFKILDIINLISFSSLSEFKSKADIYNVNELVYYARILNLFVCYFIVLTFDKINNLFIKNKSISFFITIFFIASTSIYGLLIRIRTEEFSFLFFIVSLYFVFKIIANNKRILFYLLICSFLSTIAMSAKIQIVMLIYFLPLIFILMGNVNEKFSEKDFNQNFPKYIYINFIILFIIGLAFLITIFLNTLITHTNNWFDSLPFYQFIFFSYIVFSLFVFTRIANLNFIFFLKLNLFVFSGIFLGLIVIFIHPSSQLYNALIIFNPIDQMFLYSNKFDSNFSLIERFFNYLLNIKRSSFTITELFLLILIIINNFIIWIHKKKITISLLSILFLVAAYLIKIPLSFREGAYSVPSHYLIYYIPMLFFSFLVTMRNTFVLEKYSLRLIKFGFISLLIIFSLLSININYKKIDRIVSTLDFCNYKGETKWDTFYYKYYCN